MDRALMLRGSRDFDSAESYTDFVRKVVERRNRLVQGKLEQERPLLQCLPPAPVPEYVNHQAGVRKWSTIQAAGRTYTVPSRLIGKEVQIRCTPSVWKCTTRATWWNAWSGCAVKGRPTSITATSSAPWCASPGPSPTASGEQMFPTMTFRLAYDALKRWRGERTDVEYCADPAENLAATTMGPRADRLALLLEAGEPFDYATVKELANPAPPRAPVLSLSGMPDLRVYDSLLAGVA